MTADKEFGNVLTYPPHQHAGVILVRIADNVDPEGRVDRVCQAIVALAPEDLRGVVAVVDAIRLRIRRPPPAPT